ncbi:Reverse transcriptase domain [Arabidopsis thaliana x Arabidopsis arenosa]|uniref:Reverse transcriptase domain n=1 Tax=Arabidopsis thaliana x Arabidopsis arenosa TaxID=1240361 RepID=A0A8T2AX94_9BRAS|nr:Reverse transcriptase domain [Arabidopsis thaliana x Arabidopsis arenosa]
MTDAFHNALGSSASSSGGEACTPAAAPPSLPPTPEGPIAAATGPHPAPRPDAQITPSNGRNATNPQVNTRAGTNQRSQDRSEPDDLLQNILTHLSQQEARTNVRLESLAAAQACAQDEINRLNASQTQGVRPAQGNQVTTRQIHPVTSSSENTRDLELAELRRIVQEMNTKVHKAISAAPELDRVLDETQQTPFTRRITSVSLRGRQKIKLEPYNGKGDPKEFLTSFSIAINRAELTDENFEAGQCQIFTEHLTGAALNWFARLKPNSISSYRELSVTFLKHYSPLIQNQTTNADLWSLSQGPTESLRLFIDRFKNVITRIVIPDEAAIVALRNAVWYDSKFRDDITLHVPNTLEDALHRATRYIELEEERLVLSKKHGATKASAPKEVPVVKPSEPRQHLDRNTSQGRKPATFVINSEDTAPKQWNKWARDTDAVTTGPVYCEYHKSKAHATEDCRYLQGLLMAKYKSGGIAIECDRAQGSNKNQRRNETTARQFLQDRAEGAAANDDQTNDPAKRQRQGKAIADAPNVVRQIHMIMGGLQNCNDSVRSIKQYRKKAEMMETWPVTPSQPSAEIEPISFTKDDLVGVDLPHNDPLVVELIISDSRVTRVMIDTGSSVDLIFKDTLTAMNVADRRIKPRSRPLAGFDGDFIMSLGTIKLPTFVGGTIAWVKFVVIDKPTIYNVILGTPWLHQMQAVASTYHQCVKFPTHQGIFTLKGNQQVARTLKAPGKSYEESELSRTELVNIDASDPLRCVGIGAEISPGIKAALVALLVENSSTFAWSVEDMPGIDPSITSHELGVDPTFKPVKQKRRKLGPERAKAVNDEVEKLLGAGSIIEVRYPEWLANPVVVKKKNGKWRVCVDFTDLNKACPKDCYPLPHIDRLVEATAGNELLSFMDAFSGYNQILMHKDDQEKTSFITDRGTYCYKVMPFGLKNAGATYQRLVNKMFAEQLGRTVEVYIDDMLVKSLKADENVQNLRQCFDVLNKYQMKLNPAKCTFAVTSGEFLGYVVTKRGIEANPKQIRAILELPSPRNAKEVQRLTGRIAALNRFISRSTDKCLPFYNLLKRREKFTWDDASEKAFAELKTYLTTPPVLAKPENGETLFLYIAVSSWAVSGVLVRDDRGEQRPIFYVSKSLIDAEVRYPAMEKAALAVVTSARKLRPYFQSHTVAVLTNQPIKTVLHSPSLSGRMTKWAVELSEYDIDFRARPAMKSQVLADFIIELPAVDPDDATLSTNQTNGTWTLYSDGSSSSHGSGVGIRLVSPTGEMLEQSFRLRFTATNNVAEYEALIAGLRLAIGMNVKRLRAMIDSQLVASQYSGDYEARNDRMDAYLKVVQRLSKQFTEFELTKIPRGDNAPADALAALASTSDPDLRRVIPVESIDQPSIEGIESVNLVCSRAAPDPINDPDDWRLEIRDFLSDGTVPVDKWEARRLRAKSSKYTLYRESLLRYNASGAVLSCLHKADAAEVMKETHEGAGGNHSGGRSLALKIRKLGYYWPTMISDCKNYVLKCEQCQRHAPVIHQPTELMKAGAAPYPFMRWAMDIVGPLPASRQKRFILVMTDYFTKWVEAESYATIKAKDVQNFVWKYIICRHGLPYEIITDNGSQFISLQFEDFCASWRIRLNKSTPRYPQGNGQAEATNKTILARLKKRLEAKKGVWADELDGVLWSYRTTPRSATEQTPFSLAYGMEAMAPAEVGCTSLRRSMMIQNNDLNDEMMRHSLDDLEENRNAALCRIQNYQLAAAKYYNKKVHNRHFSEGDLFLRKVFENTAELNAGKLGANWEGPYQISKIVRPGDYELLTLPTPHYVM